MCLYEIGRLLYNSAAANPDQHVLEGAFWLECSKFSLWTIVFETKLITKVSWVKLFRIVSKFRILILGKSALNTELIRSNSF